MCKMGLLAEDVENPPSVRRRPQTESLILVALFLCIGASSARSAERLSEFEQTLGDAYSSLYREAAEVRDRHRDQPNPSDRFGDSICGRVILNGAFLHHGITVEVDGTPIRAISDINGYYCLSTFEGSRNVIAWKRGWSVNQISHVEGSGGQWLPTLVLHGPPFEVLAGLYVEEFGHVMWISTSRGEQAVKMENFEQYRNWWIGGIVREDAASELGFFFQPDTVAITQFTAEDGDQNLGLQITIPELTENVEPHQGQYRYVSPRFLRYKDLRREKSGPPLNAVN